MASECVLLAEFSHETNTFAESPTDRDVFQERREYFGNDVLRKLIGTNTAVGGAIEVADEQGIEIHPIVSAAAMPGGVIPTEVFNFYADKILEGIETNESDLDAVFLALHGAMVPSGYDDGEGQLLSRIREKVGPELPIVVTLDLHGNISPEMIELADALIAFESYPHVDMGETGRTGMETLVGIIRNEISPEMHMERPPVLATYPKQNTREGPMAAVMEKARSLEAREGVLKVNVFPGFHQADIPSMGFTIPVVGDGTWMDARKAARELAAFVWDIRENLVGDYPGPEDAVSEARQLVANNDHDSGPVVMADLGDNPGGGSAGDGTTLLRELLNQDIQNGGFAIMHDPDVVEQCIKAGVGEQIKVTLGGKTDDLHGEPIVSVDGHIKAITDGEFLNTGPMGTGTENHLGRAVRLECGENHGVSVLLTENRMQPLDAEIWRHMTIQPERLDILVVKSLNHYRADYEPMASHVIPVDTVGLSAIDPHKFDYESIRRPQYPLDDLSVDAYPDWT